MKTYTYEEVLKSTLEYFNNDNIAADVWIKKYALRDNEGNLCELNPDMMHKRLASEFARIEEKKYKYTNIKPLSFDEIYNYFKNFKYIVPQGSPMFGIGNNFQYVSLSNCFVVETPYDSYGSIIRSDEQLVQISKRRGGVGIDLSNIRPKGMKVKNSSRISTGVTLFMERYSNSIKEVGQEGRRGALMLTLSIHHPDIEDFITIKRDLSKVTGANISVKITNEFLEALEKNKEYELRFPVNSKNPIVRKKISAKYIWDKIIESNWLSAEPGILLWDNILQESLPDCYAKYGFETISTNPCITSDTLISTTMGDFTLKDLLVLYEKGYTLPEIYSYDWMNDKISKDKIVKIFKTKDNADIIKLKFDNGKTIKVTPDHLIFTKNRGWVVANRINKNDLVIFIDIVNNKRVPRITQLVKKTKLSPTEVYDITTSNYSCFFGNSILLHNCSEIPLCELDSCRLMAINMFSFVENPFTSNAYFNFEKFQKCIYDAQRLMDDLVDLEIEKIDKIIEKIDNDPEPDYIKHNEKELWMKIKQKAILGRRTGLSSTGWADMLASLNIKYDSEEAINFIDKVMKIFKHTAYKSSVDMAKVLGPFPIFNAELEKNNKFLLRIKEENEELYNEILTFGRRNIALLTIAPTGTISILTQTTSGIEPLFAYSYFRKVKVNNETDSYDEIDNENNKWKIYEIIHPKLKIWCDLYNTKEYNKSPYVIAKDIDPYMRVKFQATLQKHICHSISSTINLPETVTKETINDIYLYAWKLGLKGITVYRENSRNNILSSSIPTNKSKSIIERPKIIDCNVHHITYNKKRYIILVGILNNTPFEVFLLDYENNNIPKHINKGKIEKQKNSIYKLIYEYNGKNEIILNNENVNDLYQAITRLISLSLRYKISINNIVTQLEKINSDLFSFVRAISRTLKKYIENGTKIENEKCPNCNNESLIREEGCIKCYNCGWTKCN